MTKYEELLQVAEDDETPLIDKLSTLGKLDEYLEWMSDAQLRRMMFVRQDVRARLSTKLQDQG